MNEGREDDKEVTRLQRRYVGEGEDGITIEVNKWCQIGQWESKHVGQLQTGTKEEGKPTTFPLQFEKCWAKPCYRIMGIIQTYSTITTTRMDPKEQIDTGHHKTMFLWAGPSKGWNTTFMGEWQDQSSGGENEPGWEGVVWCHQVFKLDTGLPKIITQAQSICYLNKHKGGL